MGQPINSESTRRQLEAKLHQLEETFARHMRARGFDPAQAENIPLTPELAQLQAERMQLLEALAALPD
ncbi:MAG: hypothetical protein ACRD6N_15760 [Pyrinomonadaceae bacterium]